VIMSDDVRWHMQDVSHSEQHKNPFYCMVTHVLKYLAKHFANTEGLNPVGFSFVM
jgi:hypothetical protein